MITEDYVSFETAKLLKEKGFDVNCYTHYSSDGQNVYYNYQTPSDGINMPTLQMAMKWLRQVHKVHITTYPYGDYFCDNYQFDIYKNNNFILSKDEGYMTHEQACEAAIKYCLENLI